MSADETNTAPRSRAEQRAATRTALLDAGAAAFAAKGHDGVNLAKDILEPHGISVGSFYHQFANKTELLLAIIDLATTTAQERFYDSLPADQEGMGPEAVTASFDAFLSMVDNREDLVTIQMRETYSPHPEIADAIRKLTEARLEYLRIRYRNIARTGVDVDADAMVEMSEALSWGALNAYLRTPPAERPRRKAELLDHLTTMVFAGIPGFMQQTDDEAS
ncbi:MAG: TetR/AcrR family transcriptional regulator [Actinomycetota bacterium]